jgi:hypothetical protein
LVEAKKRKLAIVKGSTAADMLANALFHAGHVRRELLRTYYEAPQQRLVACPPRSE